MFKRLRNIFIAGILVLMPLIASIYIIWYLFVVVDNWASPIVEVIFERDIPGVGIIITAFIIFITGILATNIFGKKIIQLGENLLLKVPLFSNIYVSIKGVLEGMFTTRAESFKKAVIFEYPRKGLYQIGFITREKSPYLDQITAEKLYKVFVPTTPNPTSGMLVMVPENDVEVLQISIEEALKLVISGGILSPESKYEDMKGIKNEKNHR